MKLPTEAKIDKVVRELIAAHPGQSVEFYLPHALTAFKGVGNPAIYRKIIEAALAK